MKFRLIGFSLVLALALGACSGSTPAPTTAPPSAVPATAVGLLATAVEDNPTDVAPTPPVATPTITLPQPTSTPLTPPTEAATAVAPVNVQVDSKIVFAGFNPPAFDESASLVQEPIAPDLSNVIVPFALSAEQMARLAQDGVVVSPGVEKEFFTGYEQTRYQNLPIFVTSDSLLHVYHLLFDKALRSAERTGFIPLLGRLNQAMLAQADAQYQELVGTPWQNAALRNVAFFGVGSQLLDPTVQVPAYAQELVTAELENINAASGILSSPIFPHLPSGEDYTQYIPRGHYTRDEMMQGYFRSMMWYGRMTFVLKTTRPEDDREEARAVVLLMNALRTAQVNGRPAMEAWLDLYNPTVFFVGRSDDLTPLQYVEVIKSVYGETTSLTAVTDEASLDTFMATANLLPPPQILGMVINVNQDVNDSTKGFRFMGQRFVPDAYIFRQLIYRNVGTDTNPRMLPRGLDVMAAMGSDRAYTLLDQMGDTQFENFVSQMEVVKQWAAQLTTDQWTETLYTTWLYSLQPLLKPAGENYPQFMQSAAWQDKQLNTTLGSWTELKHDTILYAKQVYAELGGGGSGAPQPLELNGYVEPVPEFYARLAGLTDMTLQGLNRRGLLAEQDSMSLQRLHDLAISFQVMAEKELRGERLTDEEYHLIRFYGGELEALTMAAADTDGDGGRPVLDEDPQAAVVADVATDPNGTVLEEGIGRVNELYAVVPMTDENGALYFQVAKGGTFSYYEFPWPMNDRLTDEAWRAMLDAGTAPESPAWIASFFSTATEERTLHQIIYSMESSASYVYWNLDSASFYQASPEVQALYQPELEALRANKQYVGHQWVDASYRSFDLQSDTTAVVTVQETWQDWLYTFEDQPGDYNTGATSLIGSRAPYKLNVTYTVTKQGDGNWLVTNVVYANQPPEWQTVP